MRPPPLPPPLPAHHQSSTGQSEPRKIDRVLIIAGAVAFAIVMTFTIFIWTRIPSAAGKINVGLGHGSAFPAEQEESDLAGAVVDTPTADSNRMQSRSSPTQAPNDDVTSEFSPPISLVQQDAPNSKAIGFDDPETANESSVPEDSESRKPESRQPMNRAIAGPADVIDYPQQKSSRAKKRLPVDGMDIVDLTGDKSPFNVSADISTIVFVIDKSGSMSGKRIKRVQTALSSRLAHLTPKQSYSILLFDTKCCPLNGVPDLIPATKASIAQSQRSLSGIVGSGDTDPRKALEVAIRLRPELIIVLSDGDFDPQFVQEITSWNQSRRPSCRIDCVGMDEVVITLQDLARSNSGMYYQAVSQ